MAHRFTSLLHPLEKLQEAEYFLGRMVFANNREFQYELNAFLSSSRAVTFVLQKAMTQVSGFDHWYEERRAEMRRDVECRFFLDLRNISQKEGPVSYVAGGRSASGNSTGWVYRFVTSDGAEVPASLRDRDVANCCSVYLGKLSTLVLECASAFPFHACPATAISEEGMAALGYSFADIETVLGLPSGYTQVESVSVFHRLRLLREEFYELEIDDLERMARGEFFKDGIRLELPLDAGKGMLDNIVSILSDKQNPPANTREAFIREALMDIDKRKDR